jgi:hypothetical protein
MTINPPCKKFIIFSGGGGLSFRSQTIEISSGQTLIEISDVPASFDPNTTTVELNNIKGNAKVIQIDVRRPDKRIMDMFINREKTASDAIIQSATDLKGSNREKIIQICESAYYRRYEDMKGTIIILVEAEESCESLLDIKYFIEDSRIKWKPTIQVEIDEKTKSANIEGYIMVMNNSDFSFENVELQFAEFELIKEVNDHGFLEQFEYEQAKQTELPATKLMKNLKKMKTMIL